MKILLIDVDKTNVPNLALMQRSYYEKQQGNEVGFEVNDPDKVIISCIFSKNAAQARGITTHFPDAEIEIGGSGISLISEMSKEVQKSKPDYDLYPSTYSQGFTTRGCIRKCPFCVVPEKEGKIRIANHPSEFHDPKFNTCMIMDNNLFAASKEWQKSVYNWFIENKIKMLSPQGWDIRLLTEENANYLKLIRHAGNIHFAWDNIENEKQIRKGIEILRQNEFNLRHNVQFYVLSNFDEKLEKLLEIKTPTLSQKKQIEKIHERLFKESLYRCEKLKEWGTNAFVMPYRKSPKINALARWANLKRIFWKTPFNEYTREKTKKIKTRKEIKSNQKLKIS